MPQYKDKNGNLHNVNLTVKSFLRIRRAVGIDLRDKLNPADIGPFLESLQQDQTLLLNILSVVALSEPSVLSSRLDDSSRSLARKALVSSLRNFCAHIDTAPSVVTLLTEAIEAV